MNEIGSLLVLLSKLRRDDESLTECVQRLAASRDRVDELNTELSIACECLKKADARIQELLEATKRVSPLDQEEEQPLKIGFGDLVGYANLRQDDSVRALTSMIATLQDQVSHYQGRICELLESNTRLLEERRAVDVHYNVEQFHRAAAFDDPRAPCVPADDIVRLRSRLVAEEFLEWVEATYDCRATLFEEPQLVGYVVEEVRALLREVIDNAPVKVDLPEWADATVDLDYVVEGSRLMFGIDGRPLLREVQRANMAKFGPGSWRRPEDGKIMKPPNWTPPDIAGELRKQGWRGPGQALGVPNFDRYTDDIVRMLTSTLRPYAFRLSGEGSITAASDGIATAPAGFRLLVNGERSPDGRVKVGDVLTLECTHPAEQRDGEFCRLCKGRVTQ